MKALEVKAREADRLHDEHGMYDLSQAELDRMAERCELRWDTVPYRLGEPLRLPDEDAAELGLSPAQHAAVDAALQKESAYLVSTIREAYVTLTGDDPQAILSVAPSALFDEVEDKTPVEERRRVYQLLSNERARGDASRLDAAALAALSPYERMYRAVTSSGDRLMAALREAVGPDLARSLRDLHDGFGSRSRSMVGCPGQGDE
ncbi:MAG: hypothetical protein H6745_05235 [Deltaproteobacteria bacterium]|nr:hypothetical protein [Deltaproteobacteria bacterium]